MHSVRISFAGIIIASNIYTLCQTVNSLLFSQRTHLQRAVAKHDLVQSEGKISTTWPSLTNQQRLTQLFLFRLPAGGEEGGEPVAGNGESFGRLFRTAVKTYCGEIFFHVILLYLVNLLKNNIAVF